MVKLLALVPLLVSFEHKAAQETAVPPAGIAPTPYPAVAAVKPAASANEEAATRIRYAYAEINRLRAQVADLSGRLDESRANYVTLDSVSDAQAARISKREAQIESLQKEIASLTGKFVAARTEKRLVETKIAGLEASVSSAWTYCLLVGLAFVVLLLYGTKYADSFRAILARLPDKEKDDQIAALQIELDKLMNAFSELKAYKALYEKSRDKRKRAGAMIADLIRCQYLASRRIDDLLNQIDRVAVQFNGLRLADLRFRDGRIEALQRMLEDAGYKLEARDEVIMRLINFQNGSERTIERISLEAYEMACRIAELEEIVAALRQTLVEANETIAVLNGGLAAPATLPATTEEMPTAPPIDPAVALAEAELTAQNAIAIESSRATMLGMGTAGLPPSELPPIADETPPPCYSR
jgi:chromosome segregation ATPase